MSRVYTDTIEPRKPTQDITLGTTGETITLPGNDLRVNTVKDKGGNTLWTSDGSGNLSNLNNAFKGDLKLIQTQTISSAVANVSFTTGIDSTYDLYIFKFIEIACSAVWAQFSFNASDDGGTTYAVIKTSSFFDSDKMEIYYSSTEDGSINRSLYVQNLETDEKRKLTIPKILSRLKKIVSSQNKPIEKDIIRFVKNKHNLYLKGYSLKAKKDIKKLPFKGITGIEISNRGE